MGMYHKNREPFINAQKYLPERVLITPAEKGILLWI